jgi:hypothetical protein
MAVLQVERFQIGILVNELHKLTILDLHIQQRQAGQVDSSRQVHQQLLVRNY